MSTYNVIRQLGTGSGGIVYLAWHTRLEKYVVLKQLKTQAYRPELLRREVDVLKNLRHAYLPQVYDFFQDNGNSFLVEDYIQGEDLEHMLARGCVFSEEQLTRWLDQLCQVLRYLHTQQPPILHCDIKPANIMVDAKGDICLIDFNVAIGVNEGVIFGYTREYASPELMIAAQQGGVSPQQLTPESDIYSLCATFYALMSHRLPNQGREAPLTALQLPYSVEFRELIERGMRRNGWRCRSAKELEAGLHRLERLSGRYRVFWWGRLAAWTLGALLIAGGSVMLWKGVQQNWQEAYQADYFSVQRTYNAYGATPELAERAQDLLLEDHYGKIREQRPEETAQLYAIQGEYYYSQDTRADYANAAEYYHRAATITRNEENRQVYLRNYACALSLCGQSDQARQAAAGLTAANAQLVEGEILYYEGKYPDVLALAGEAVHDGTFTKELADLASRAAQRTEQWDAAVYWQEQNWGMAQDTPHMRTLAETYLRAGVASGTREYLERAEALYGTLATKTTQDQLNWALARYKLGNWNGSLELLAQVRTSAQDKVSICLCEYYEAMNRLAKGERALAYDACRRALAQEETMTEAQRRMIDSEGLHALADTLG